MVKTCIFLNFLIRFDTHQEILNFAHKLASIHQVELVLRTEFYGVLMGIRLQFFKLSSILLCLMICQVHLQIVSNDSYAMNEKNSQEKPTIVFNTLADWVRHTQGQKIEEQVRKEIEARLEKEYSKREPSTSPKEKKMCSRQLPLKERIAVRFAIFTEYQEEINKRGKNVVFQMARDYFDAMNELDELYSSALENSEEIFTDIQDFIRNAELKERFDENQGELIKIAANFAITMIEHDDPRMNHELLTDTRRFAQLSSVRKEQMLNIIQVLSISWAARTDSQKFTPQEIQDNKLDLVLELAKLMCDSSQGGEASELDYVLIKEYRDRIAMPSACDSHEFFYRLIKRFISKEKNLNQELTSDAEDSDPFEISSSEPGWEIIEEKPSAEPSSKVLVPIFTAVVHQASKQIPQSHSDYLSQLN